MYLSKSPTIVAMFSIKNWIMPNSQIFIVRMKLIIHLLIQITILVLLKVISKKEKKQNGSLTIKN